MSICEKCKENHECAWQNHEETICKEEPAFPFTNADRIRMMTDEELADRILGYVRCEACEREFHIECNPLKTCRGVWLDWLKEEVKKQ